MTTVRPVYVHGQRTPIRPSADSCKTARTALVLIADCRRHEPFQSFGILRPLSSQLPVALAQPQFLPENLAPSCIGPDDRAATVEADKAHLSLIHKDLGKGWR